MNILFLGYDQSQTRLINALVKKGCSIDHAEGLIDGNGYYDLVVSFGYRHILSAETIATLNCPIFNLHISYLPYNRGCHPNFWSFYENTPSGVTIHLIDDGVDTGPIIYQRYVVFDNNEITFADTYQRLIDEVESLFEENLSDILNGHWVSKPQNGQGTLHFFKDLPAEFSNWNAIIEDEIARLNIIKENENVAKTSDL